MMTDRFSWGVLTMRAALETKKRNMSGWQRSEIVSCRTPETVV